MGDAFINLFLMDKTLDWHGKVSHTAQSQKGIRKGSSRHSSLHMMVLLGMFHLIQAPWVTNSMDLALLPSSSRFQTLSWIMVLFFWDCNLTTAETVPRHYLPVQGFSIMSLVQRADSARLTAVLVTHLLPDLVLIPASLILEVLKCQVKSAFAAQCWRCFSCLTGNGRITFQGIWLGSLGGSGPLLLKQTAWTFQLFCLFGSPGTLTFWAWGSSLPT